MGFPRQLHLPADAEGAGHGFYPWVGKIPWRRKWQPTPVFLPGNSQGQRNLVDYCPWGCKDLATEQSKKEKKKKERKKEKASLNHLKRE